MITHFSSRLVGLALFAACCAVPRAAWCQTSGTAPLSTPLSLQPLEAPPLEAPPLELEPPEISLPSEAPGGNAVNDRVLFRYYPAPSVGATPENATVKSPAVILLHYLGGNGDAPRLAKLARDFNRHGMAAAVMTLPYHGRRQPPGDNAYNHFVGSAATIAQAFEQSAADVSTLVTWLSRQPSVDAHRIGAVGVSLGAFVVHLSMGRDARITAGIAALGAGNLAHIFLKTRGRKRSAQDDETLHPVDPLSYADRNLPRRVLMIQAARDILVPPRYAEQLWNALGRPPIQWVDVNHTGLLLGANSLSKTTIAYLETAWGSTPSDVSKVPRVRVPTFKIGFLTGLDSRVTPAVQWQFFSLGTREHMALVHADAGLSGRGPFLGLAATVNRFVDLGVARRARGHDLRPYASLHVVF